MKKIVVFGVGNLYYRRWIEEFLGDEYEIVGYSDSKYDEDIVDGKPFIPIERINSLNFEFIVLAIKTETNRSQIYELLINEGVPEERIIPLLILDKQEMYCQIGGILFDLQNYADREARMIFVGNSNSLSCIDKACFKDKVYDASLPGMTIYYYFKVIQYILMNNIFPDAQVYNLVLDYDELNWDMSMSEVQYTSGQIFALSEFHDWHRAHETRNVTIERYIANYDLFADKFIKKYRCHKKGEYNWNHVINEIDDNIAGFRSAFTGANHKYFTEDNLDYLSKIFDLLKTHKKVFNVILNPFFMGGCKDEELRKQAEFRIQDMRKNLEQLEAKRVIELHSEFCDEQLLFRDAQHFNLTGAKKYGEKLAGIINDAYAV